MKSISKALFPFAVAALAALSLSCATGGAYNGPVADHPVVNVEYFRHLNTAEHPENPTWTHNAILHVSNPSDKRPMNVLVDCDASQQPKFKGTPATGGTRMHLVVAPRTTQDVMLAPDDGDCTVNEE